MKIASSTAVSLRFSTSTQLLGLIFLLSAILSHAQTPSGTALHDTAIARAQTFLEDHSTQSIVVFALHQGATVSGQATCNSAEQGAVALVTCVYFWRFSGAAEHTNTLTFRCNGMGEIDKIMDVKPNGDDSFVKFTQSVKALKDEAVDEVIDEVAEDQKERQKDTPGWVIDLADIGAKLFAENAIPANGQAVLEYLLVKGYDLSNHQPGRPEYGMDDFRFGPGDPSASRQFSGTAQAFQAALPQLLRNAAIAADIKDPDYDVESAAIAAAATQCSQITANAAFQASDEGGFGEEIPYRLGSAFQICAPSFEKDASQSTSHADKSRSVLYKIAPAGRGWKDARGAFVEIQFRPRQSDPGFQPDEAFERYGIVRAHIAQAEIPCDLPAVASEPADQVWRQDGTPLLFRVRFECQHAEIYNAGNHYLVADLTLTKPSSKGGKFKGVGPFSPCPNHAGKVEFSRWSATRIEGTVQFPNKVTHECGGLKEGYVLNGTLHTDYGDLVLVPAPGKQYQ